MQHLFSPLSAGMSIIRPAQPPYPPGGLMLQLCLTAQQQGALAASGALAALAPDATWVGGEGLLSSK